MNSPARRSWGRRVILVIAACLVGAFIWQVAKDYLRVFTTPRRIERPGRHRWPPSPPSRLPAP